MRVLFVSRDNARRSPMAEAFLRFLHPTVEAASAGIAPAERLDPFAVAVMRERHIEIGAQQPVRLTEEMVRAAQIVVAVGALPSTPLLPPGSAVEWDIAELAGRPLDDYRRARAAIESLVFGLIDDLETFRMLQMKRQGARDPFTSYFPGR